MWNISGQTIANERFEPFLPNEILDDYDGPRLFTVKNAAGEPNLACWSDGDVNFSRYERSRGGLGWQDDRRSMIEKLAGQGYGALAQYRYMVQEVKQFRNEEDFAMQQALSEQLEQLDGELVTRMLEDAIKVLKRTAGLEWMDQMSSR